MVFACGRDDNSVLCQPLTTLQCALEIGEIRDTLEADREAASVAKAECARLVEAVSSRREIVRVATDGTQAAEAGL